MEFDQEQEVSVSESDENLGTSSSKKLRLVFVFLALFVIVVIFVLIVLANLNQIRDESWQLRLPYSNLRAHAEIFVSDNDTYEGFCETEVMQDALTAVRNYNAELATCFANEQSWAAELKFFKDELIFCVDSFGTATRTSHVIDIDDKTYSCSVSRSEVSESDFVDRPSYIEKSDGSESPNRSCTPLSDQTRIFKTLTGEIDESVKFQNPLSANLSVLPLARPGGGDVLFAKIIDGRGLDLGSQYILETEWRCHEQDLPTFPETIDMNGYELKYVLPQDDDSFGSYKIISDPVPTWVSGRDTEIVMKKYYGNLSFDRLLITEWDINFDGFNDVGVWTADNNLGSAYYFYLFDPEYNNFDLAMDCRRAYDWILHDPVFDSNAKTITAQGKGDRWIYEFKDGCYELSEVIPELGSVSIDDTYRIDQYVDRIAIYVLASNAHRQDITWNRAEIEQTYINIDYLLTDWDIDFDGIHDLAILNSVGYAGANRIYTFYVWDREQEHLVPVEELSFVSNPTFDSSTKTISSSMRGMPYNKWDFAEYWFQDGKYVLGTTTTEFVE